MAERDENGRLQKGHGGLKPKGAISKKTQQWEALAESIIGEHSEGFNAIMRSLKHRAEHEDDLDATELYLNNYTKILDYFKPKLQRVTQVGEEGAPPVQIVISERIANKI